MASCINLREVKLTRDNHKVSTHKCAGLCRSVAECLAKDSQTGKPIYLNTNKEN